MNSYANGDPNLPATETLAELLEGLPDPSVHNEHGHVESLDDVDSK